MTGGERVVADNGNTACPMSGSQPLHMDGGGWSVKSEEEALKNVDGYRLSTFMHKHAEADGGKLVLGPLWDVNLGFDNADYGNTHTPDGWAF